MLCHHISWNYKAGRPAPGSEARSALRGARGLGIWLCGHRGLRGVSEVFILIVLAMLQVDIFVKTYQYTLMGPYYVWKIHPS